MKNNAVISARKHIIAQTKQNMVKTFTRHIWQTNKKSKGNNDNRLKGKEKRNRPITQRDKLSNGIDSSTILYAEMMNGSHRKATEKMIYGVLTVNNEKPTSETKTLSQTQK